MAANLVKFLVLTLVFGLVLTQSQSRLDRLKVRSKRPTPTTTTKAPSIHSDNDDGTSDDCPEPYGFFADADQCDKYYACNDGQIEERLCKDGLVFNEYDINVEKCDLPNNIDCSKKSKLQTPIPSADGNCPRQNGYYAHKSVKICDKFFFCVDGQPNAITCPAGLVFNQKTGICTWPDQAAKAGCSSEEFFNFSCPKVVLSIAATHPRYSDPDDCQYFYVCVNGETPRRSGCKLGQVFNDATKACDWPRNVAECTDFYKDRLTDAELEELENPKTTPKTVKVNGSVAPRRRPSRPPKKRVVVEEDEE